MSAWRPAEPELQEIKGGRWLARTPRDHPYRIGVVGDTEEEAQRRFAGAMAAWEDLHEHAVQERQRAEERRARRRGQGVASAVGP